MGSNTELTVAIAAAALSGVALIAVFLQVLLQYLSSSNGRLKCSYAAIGGAHKYVKSKWSFSEWKFKSYYPILELDYDAVLKEFMHHAQRSIEMHPKINRVIVRGHDRAWIQPKSHVVLTNWHVADTFDCLVDKSKDNRLVRLWDLTLNEAFTFLRYRLKNWRQPLIRPRASWAQLLTAMGITDVKELKIDLLVDSETVPSNLDTPLQRIKLRDLGSIAFALGFHKVNIDVSARVFSAYSPLGSITTEEVPVVGKVLRFEGDILGIKGWISRCSSFWIWRAGQLIDGQASFGRYHCNGLFWPLATIANSLACAASQKEFRELQRMSFTRNRKSFAAGPVLREAYLLKDSLLQLLTTRDEFQNHLCQQQQPHGVSAMAGKSCSIGDTGSSYSTEVHQRLQLLMLEGNSRKTKVSEEDMRDTIAQWQVKTENRIPTMFAAATFMTVHSVYCAFPSRALLHVMLPWVRHRAKRFVKQKDNPIYLISENLSDAIILGNMNFARENSRYLLSYGRGGDAEYGLFGWGCTDMHRFFTEMPAEVQREIVPSGQRWEVNAILTEDTAQLLHSFDIQTWASNFMDKGWASIDQVRVINLLWIQIVVLDIAIQYYIHGRWDFESMSKAKNGVVDSDDPLLGDHWGSKESAVVRSIVKSWRPLDTEADYGRAENGPMNLAEPNVDPTEGSNPAEKLEIRQILASAAAAAAVEDEERPVLEVQIDEAENNSSLDGHESQRPILLSPPTSGNGHGSGTLEQLTESLLTASSPRDRLHPDDSISTSDAATLTPAQLPTIQPWQIAEHLEDNMDVFPGRRDELTRARCRRLANLLELRAIFVVAFLFMHPDSSDVYLTEGEDIEMPMA